jgi:O-methyltransferase involved in polyketide biosynthesis
MYLTPAQVDATLAQIAHRSAPKSRLIAQYNERALIMTLLGLSLRRIGEPLRSAWSPAEMRALLERHGFKVTRDESLATIAQSLSSELGQKVRRVRHTRIVTADR